MLGLARRRHDFQHSPVAGQTNPLAYFVTKPLVGRPRNIVEHHRPGLMHLSDGHRLLSRYCDSGTPPTGRPRPTTVMIAGVRHSPTSTTPVLGSLYRKMPRRTSAGLSEHLHDQLPTSYRSRGWMSPGLHRETRLNLRYDSRL